MANKLVGYYNNTDIFQADWIYAFSYPNIATGDKIISITQNDATKFALIAIPSGSGSSRNYEVYLFSNSTVNYTINRNYRSRYYNGNVDPGWDNWSEGPMYESTYNSYSAESPTPAWSYYPIRCQLGGISYKMLDENNLPIFVDSNKNPIEFINILDSDWNRTVIQDFILEVMGKPAIPPKGRGTVTLDIPANGANLTFISALLGVSVTKMISKDDVVNIEGEPPVGVDWEVFWDVNWGSALNAVLSVDSNFNSHYATPYNSEVIGSLLERNLSDQSGDNIYALDNIYGCRTYIQAGSISFNSFATGDVVSDSSWHGVNGRITIAKKTSGNTLPFEVCFIWHHADSMQRTLIKRDGTQYGNDITITGEFITEHINLSGNYPEEVTIAPFDGMIKIYKNGDSVISVSGSSGYSFSSSDTATWMIFAIPN